jgi:hypothetical protein
MLDEQGLNRIYDISENGRIVGIGTGTVHLPVIPVCYCGVAISGVRRYTVIRQLHAFPSNFDKLVAKVARKLNMFGDRVQGQETLLADTIDFFCHSIRPVPLAAAHNKACVFGRGTAITDIQNKIVSFRGKCNFQSTHCSGHRMQVFFDFVRPWTQFSGAGHFAQKLVGL